MTIEFQLQSALNLIEVLQNQIAELEGLELLNAALLEYIWRACGGNSASIRSAVEPLIQSDEARDFLLDEPFYLDEDEQTAQALESLNTLLSFRSNGK